MSNEAKAVIEAALKAAAVHAPKVGEVWWVDFNPVKGHEQGNKRPAVILSAERWNRGAKLAIVVPVTKTFAPEGSQRATLQVEIKGMKERSVALPFQITTIGWEARGATYSGCDASPEELAEIRLRVAALTGIS